MPLQVALVSRYWTWPFILFVLLSYWLVYPFEVTPPCKVFRITPVNRPCPCTDVLPPRQHAHLPDISC